MCQERSQLKSYMVFVCVLAAIFGASMVGATHYALDSITRSNLVFREYLAAAKEIDGLKQQQDEVMGRHARLSRALQSIVAATQINPQIDLLLRAQNIYLTAPESK